MSTASTAPPTIAGDDADRDAERHRQRDGAESDGERDAAAVDQPREDVAAVGIRAERMRRPTAAGSWRRTMSSCAVGSYGAMQRARARRRQRDEQQHGERDARARVAEAARGASGVRRCHRRAHRTRALQPTRMRGSASAAARSAASSAPIATATLVTSTAAVMSEIVARGDRVRGEQSHARPAEHLLDRTARPPRAPAGRARPA